MTTLYRYQPVITPGPGGTDYRPFAEGAIELCTLDGWRYVTIPENTQPDVPVQLTTWMSVELTPELREAIKTNSPHCKLARDRFIETIRAKHSLDDELYYARIATGSILGAYKLQDGEAEILSAYQADVEAARETLHTHYSEWGL